MTEQQTERLERAMGFGARCGALGRMASEVLREGRGTRAPLSEVLGAVEYAILVELQAQWEAKADSEGNIWVTDESPFKAVIDSLEELIGKLEQIECE